MRVTIVLDGEELVVEYSVNGEYRQSTFLSPEEYVITSYSIHYTKLYDFVGRLFFSFFRVWKADQSKKSETS